MKKPLVSIGLPVFRGEQYLKKTLDSLLAQSYKNFELLISDNASDDETPNICKAYKKIDNRIAYVRQQENIVAGNFQFVLEKANGKYFMFAAHDDLWDKEFIEKLVDLLENNSRASIAFCSIVGIDNNDNKIWDCPWTFNLPSRLRIWRLIKFISQNDLHRKPVIIYGLYRKSHLVNAGGFKQWSKFDYGRVLHILLSVLLHGDIVLTDSVSFYKRKTGIRHYEPVNETIAKPSKNFFLRKISSAIYLYKNARNHNFIKHLDGYWTVIRSSNQLFTLEKALLLLFLLCWKYILTLRIILLIIARKL